jgi:hypothetical protein
MQYSRLAFGTAVHCCIQVLRMTDIHFKDDNTSLTLDLPACKTATTDGAEPGHTSPAYFAVGCDPSWWLSLLPPWGG